MFLQQLLGSNDLFEFLLFFSFPFSKHRAGCSLNSQYVQTQPQPCLFQFASWKICPIQTRPKSFSSLLQTFGVFSATVRQLKQSLRFDIKLHLFIKVWIMQTEGQLTCLNQNYTQACLQEQLPPPPRRSCLKPGESRKKCWRGCVRAGHMCRCALKCSVPAYSVIWTQPLTTPLSVEREPAHSRCAVSSVHTQSSVASVLDAAADGSHARNECPKQQR